MPKQFASTMDSFTVDGKLNKAKQFAAAQRASTRTPTLVVNGKYRVKGKSFEDMLRIADQLIARERAAQGGAADAGRRRRAAATTAQDTRRLSSCSAPTSRPAPARAATATTRPAAGRTCCRPATSAARWTRSRKLAGEHDIVGLQESDPGSWRSGFTNQTHYLAEHGGFDYWSHQPNRRVGSVASSANGLLSKLEPVEVIDHPLPGRITGRGVLMARFGDGDEGLVIAVAHLSLGAQSRRAQLAFIAELLHDHPHAVLMGDFNCAAGPPGNGTALQRTHLQPPACCVPTFPSWRPHARDRPHPGHRALACQDLRAFPAAFSDHLALSIVLEVPERALQR